MKSRRVGAVAVTALIALLVALPACGRSSSSNTTTTAPVSIAKCDAVVKTSNGLHFTVPVIIGVVGAGVTPKLNVSLSQATVTGGADNSLTLKQVSISSTSRPTASVSAFAQGGRAILAPAFDARGWTDSGSGVQVHIRIAIAAKNKADASDDEGNGECKKDPTIRRLIKKTYYCLRANLERAIRVVIQFAEKENGWTYTLVEAANKDVFGGGFPVTIAGKTANTGGQFSVTVQERVGSGKGAFGPSKPLTLRKESGPLPEGAYLYIDGKTNAIKKVGGQRIAGGKDLRCQVSPPVLVGPELFGLN
jgi:hypothetical protein